MNKSNPLLLQIYPGRYFFWAGGICIAVFVISYFMQWPFLMPQALFWLFIAATVIDFIYLFFPSHRFICNRQLANRFSNSDVNPVSLRVWHNFPFALQAEIIEEWPEALQQRQNSFKKKIAPGSRQEINYTIRPMERGEYQFGHTICMLQSGAGLAQRRLKLSEPVTVKVYPSFRQLRQFQLRAAGTWLQQSGTGKVRKTGHSLEFDHIKEYVIGDDIRGINWKATARKSSLMMNHYVEEKSQQVFALIDKGRLMKMPFGGLSLLDYAINATIMLSNAVLQKQDRMGLVTFSHNEAEYLPATRASTQLATIQERLYKLETEFLESDFEKVYLQVRAKIKQRSLLLLFTNFESVSGMQRQLPYMKLLSKHHLLIVIIFENSELANLAQQQAPDLETVYTTSVAAKFVYDKKRMVHEMQRQGISCMLVRPESLTTSIIDKYIEIKTKQAL